MNIFVKKACLLAVVGTAGIIILVGALQKNKAEPPVYHEYVSTGLKAIPVYGAEGEVPQKLIDELNNKRVAANPL